MSICHGINAQKPGMRRSISSKSEQNLKHCQRFFWECSSNGSFKATSAEIQTCNEAVAKVLGLSSEKAGSTEVAVEDPGGRTVNRRIISRRVEGFYR